MPATPQAGKAELLRSLHSAGGMLLLPNVWDPIGARVLESTGYRAVATTSAGIANSLGFQDGQQVRRQTVVEVLRRIADSVGVPVTADIERGYGESLDELQDTIAQVIGAGVVGINFEDGLGDGRLRPIEEQCERLAAVREAAARTGVPLVLNARTDAFLSDRFADTEERIEESATRAAAYTAAGADCIYPIGPGDAPTVRALRARIRGPLNILGSPQAAPLSELRAIGVERVSFGSWVFRASLGTFAAIARDLYDHGSFETLRQNSPSSAVVRGWLRADAE